MQIRADSSSFLGYGALTVLVNANSTNSSFRTATFTNGNGSGLCWIADSGNVYNTNSSYGSSSDIKLKDNIVDATPKLADLMRVQIRNYNLKTKPDEKLIGVISQELETVFPGMIESSKDYDDEGNDLGTVTKHVKYSIFVPMLVKAMQEQQALITTLQEQVTALQAKLTP